jgi:hypothetical protein
MQECPGYDKGRTKVCITGRSARFTIYTPPRDVMGCAKAWRYRNAGKLAGPAQRASRASDHASRRAHHPSRHSRGCKKSRILSMREVQFPRDYCGLCSSYVPTAVEPLCFVILVTSVGGGRDNTSVLHPRNRLPPTLPLGMFTVMNVVIRACGPVMKGGNALRATGPRYVCAM